MECYSLIKDEILPLGIKWIDLEGIMLSEISQTKKSYDFSCMWNIKQKETKEETMNKQ